MRSRLAALIPNKREFLARRLRDTGMLRLLERAARRPALLVVTYHRIGRDPESPYYDPVDSASAEAFRRQLRDLRDHFRIVGLHDLLDLAARDLPLAEPTALITFDDGYRDNYERALPILRELGVPAVFFIPTSFFEEPRLPWWDHAAFVLKRTARTRIELAHPEPLTIEVAPSARDAAIAEVIGLYLTGRIVDEPTFRRHLEERADVSVDEAALGRALFMSWDQVRALADAGHAIGSHSHDHRRLAGLSDDEQRRDLAESKRLLEARLGRPIEALAYPFGWAGTYAESTKQTARSLGYRLAFASAEALNRPGEFDPFEIRRLSVGYADSPILFRARTALHGAIGKSFL